ncbi:MAG: HEAT repeat domain-containing protein, partial [Acidimicrobiia bacterium]
AFVEAFFFLPDDHQLAVFRRFLDGREEANHQVFLDQFAGHELVRLAPRLDTDGLAMLLQYARAPTDQADRRPDELMALLQTPDALGSVRQMVAERIEEQVGGFRGGPGLEGTLDRIRSQRPDPQRYFYDALDLFRGMLHVEVRDAKFQRLLRIWSGKIAAAVRRGEFRRAELWMRAATDAPTYETDRSPAVDNALQHLARSEVTATLVTFAAEASAPEAAVRMLEALGERSVDTLVDLLADAEDSGRRRALIEVLARVAAADPTRVLERLQDGRWYVVRNLAMVLARSGNPAARPGLEASFAHPDHRVRVEALRGLAVGKGDGGLGVLERALHDQHELVRTAAVGYLAGRGDPGSEQVLIEALAAPRIDPTLGERIVRALGHSRSPAAREALTRYAGRRFVFSAAARHLRDAARQALNKAVT